MENDEYRGGSFITWVDSMGAEVDPSRLLDSKRLNCCRKYMVCLVFVAVTLTQFESYGTRALTRDESMYPEPTEFRPERFLATDSAPGAMDPRRFTFGHGRRQSRVSRYATNLHARNTNTS